MPARYTLMVWCETFLLRCAQKYLRVSSEAGRSGIPRLPQNDEKAEIPAWYMHLVDAATPCDCSLLRRAVSEVSALQGWVMGGGSCQERGNETLTAANGKEAANRKEHRQ